MFILSLVQELEMRFCIQIMLIHKCEKYAQYDNFVMDNLVI